MLSVVAYSLWRGCCSQGNEKYPAFSPWVEGVGVTATSSCSPLRKRRGRDVRKLRGMPDGSLGHTLTHARGLGSCQKLQTSTISQQKSQQNLVLAHVAKTTTMRAALS